MFKHFASYLLQEKYFGGQDSQVLKTFVNYVNENGKRFWLRSEILLTFPSERNLLKNISVFWESF